MPGTIPVSFHAHPYPKDGEKDTKYAELAGKTLASPYANASKEERMAAMKRGQALFNRICIACHGPRGEGDGPVTGPDLFPAPPSLHTEQALAFKDGHIFHIITRGQKKMPHYGDVIEPGERWDIVAYIRAMQKAKQMADGGN